jgi:ABC-type microcin C transport system permease subunit YejE
VAGFVVTPAVKIVVIVFVVAASVRDLLAGLYVGEIVSLVVGMSVGMYSYWLIGYFVGVGYFPGAIVVFAEAEHKLVFAAVQTDLYSG